MEISLLVMNCIDAVMDVCVLIAEQCVYLFSVLARGNKELSVCLWSERSQKVNVRLGAIIVPGVPSISLLHSHILIDLKNPDSSVISQQQCFQTLDSSRVNIIMSQTSTESSGHVAPKPPRWHASFLGAR